MGFGMMGDLANNHGRFSRSNFFFMKYLTSKYTSYRGKLLSQKKCQKFFQFVTLPELKIFKTIGFILTIIF